MNRTSIGWGSLVAGVLAACAIGATPTQAAAGGRGIAASATGSGQITIGGEMRTFAFTAQRDAANNTRGQAEVINRDAGIRVHMTLNCLQVAGNVATMSGSITESNSSTAAFATGDPIWFQVVDNGEGAGAAPDLISLVYASFGPPGIPCTSPLVPATIPIEGGNIQVR